HGRQSSSPDATRIEGGDIGLVDKPQGRPMTEDDARSAPARLARLEPRNQSFSLRLLLRSLCPQHQSALLVEVAHAREAIDDEAQALGPLEGIVPPIRLIAVQPLQQPFRVAPQSALEFARALPGQR